MKMTLRWFGSKSDHVTLRQIRQIPGVTGIMGVLDCKNAGEAWADDEIAAYINEVHDSGLKCEVIESVNVHEDIKMGLPSRDEYIANYAVTIRNLANHGVKVIIYNFMPVFDWLRTDLNRIIDEDGSYSMYFDEREMEGLNPLDIVCRMERGSGGFSLPGWEPTRLATLERTIELYENVTPERLLFNHKYFLDSLVPVCEECGITLACHPDDPAWPIFGLPRTAYSSQGLDKIIALNDSPANALCLCSGSLATNRENDIPRLIRRYGRQGRVACVHIRNVKHLGYRHFRETSHLSSDGDLDMVEIVRAVFEACPEIYVRPDHGRMIWGESGRPGYGLYDRALGVAYLNGIWETLCSLHSIDLKKIGLS